MPQISIIVPCYNEQASIHLLLDAIFTQTYPRQQIEVVVADGMSTDATRAKIASWGSEHSELEVRIVDNPQRVIPAALNQALRAAKGEFIIRLDAHSIPEPDYVEQSVLALQEEKGDNVGGIWQIQPGAGDWMAKSIAVAAAHPLGVGSAQYRVGGQPQPVDTVPFGAFRRELIEQIGFFDETLLSNEDYEYNARIRKAGGVVWFDPKIKTKYIARSTFKDLARQYWRYGYWKFQMLRRYPGTIRWRQGLPPLFVISLVGLGLFSLWFGWARWLLVSEVLFYGLVLGSAGVFSAYRQGQWTFLIGVPLAIAVMHVSWGLAFLWSILKTLFG